MAEGNGLSVRKIAKLTGYSPATVSRAMNNSTKVAPEARRRIVEVLRENGQFESTAFSPYRTIGIIAASTESDYYVSLLREAIGYFDAKGDRVVTFFVDEQRTCGADALRTMNALPLDGIIAIDFQDRLLNQVSGVRAPVIWIDGNTSDPDSCIVTSDHYVAGKLAAGVLLDRGCRRTLFITGQGDSPRGQLRLSGFLDAYAGRGIDYDHSLIVHTPTIHHPFQEGREAVIYNHTKGLAFDSVFAVNDWRAVGAYLAVREMGYKVPEQIKVLGYDGISIASERLYHLASIRQNTALIARHACEMIERKIAGRPISEGHVIVPVDLVAGTTI